MNLIQQAEQLKNLPDQALAQMQQRPTETPPYLVVAEMQRRANMRKAYQNAQQGPPMQSQPPVAQQMAQQLQQPQQAPQQPMPQQAPPPMQMAGGGLASLAGYFDQMSGQSDLPDVDLSMSGMSPYPGDPRWDEMRRFKSAVPDIRNHAAYVDEMKNALGGSPLSDIASRYEQEEKDLRGKKPKLSQILMNLGLGMAASRRPDFAGAIGEGGLNALQGYTAERSQTQAMADKIAEKRLRALEGAQRHNDRIQDYAIDARRGDIASRNTAISTNNNIELGIMRQQKEEELAERLANRQITQQQAQFELAEFNKRADAERKAAEAEYDRGTKLAVAAMRNAGRGAQRGEGESKSNGKANALGERVMDNYNQMANSYEQQALKIAQLLENPALPPERAAKLQAKMESLQFKADEKRQLAEEMGEELTGKKQKPKSSSDLGTGKMLGKPFLYFGELNTSTPNPNAKTIRMESPPSQRRPAGGNLATGSLDQQPPRPGLREMFPWNR